MLRNWWAFDYSKLLERSILFNISTGFCFLNHVPYFDLQLIITYSRTLMILD